MGDMNEFLSLDKLKDNTRKIVLPNNIGTFLSEKIKINKDVYVHKNDTNINKDMSKNSKTTNRYLDIHIALNDDFYYKSNLTGDEQYLKSGHTLNSFINQADDIVFKKANTRFQSISIMVKDDFLQNNLFKHMKNTKDIYLNPTTIFKNKPTNLKTQMLATELFNSPHSGVLDKMYKESKVLEILYYEFSDILNNDKELKNKDKVRFDEYDTQALNKAHDILLNNLQNPPTVEQLSKLVHLNQFKLKLGFKQKFNTSPYKLLRKHRMQKAKQLLEQGDMNVFEVSELVGYKYQNNFTKVFKEYFGIRPSELIKNRKYYS